MRPRNQAGPHRVERSVEPIEPECLYPIDALRTWGFGARGREQLKRAGLVVSRFGRLKFVMGKDLIRVLTHEADWQPDGKGGQPRRKAGQEESRTALAVATEGLS